MAGFQPAILFECAIPGSLTWSDQGSLLTRNEAADQVAAVNGAAERAFLVR
jgi:hypothetical protein